MKVGFVMFALLVFLFAAAYMEIFVPMGNGPVPAAALILGPAETITSAPSATPSPMPTRTTQPIVAESNPSVGIHVVASGETFYGIAAQYGIPLGIFWAANPTVNPQVIHVGNKLNVPSAGFNLYKVRSGETLSEIAEQFSISVEELMEANGIIDANLVKVGQVLRIPVC